MGKDAQEEEAGRYSGLLSAYLHDFTNTPEQLRLGSYQLRGYTPEMIGRLLSQSYGASERNLLANRSRAIGQTGALASGRGYSMGLRNPFAYSQLAENQANQSFAGSLAGLAEGRARIPIDALNAILGINRANFEPLLAGLQLQSGNIANRAPSPWPAIGAGLISAGGQAAAGGI